MSDSARADQWLWATRFFKTRSQAARTCADGQVKRAGHPVKAATALHAEDVLEIPFPEGPGARTIRVKSLIAQRVSAPQAQECYEDLTEPAVYETLRSWHTARKDAGAKPTKRERREIGKIRGFWD